MAIVGLAAHQTSATTGTGAYELDGDVGGALSLVQGAAIESGDNVGPWEVEYVARSGTDIENGIGTLTAGAPATLTRDTIIRSTNGNAAIAWGGGTRDVFLAPGATTLSLLSEATADADPDTLARRDASGRLRAATPTASSHLATKGYVDAADIFLQDAVEDAQAAADAAQDAADAAASAVSTHAARTDNPHGVTKAQVGLGSVLNQAQIYLAASALGENGSASFTNGTATVILKWGRTTAPTGRTDVPFDDAFPTAHWIATGNGTRMADQNSNVHVDRDGLGGISIYNGGTSQAVNWFAIGN